MAKAVLVVFILILNIVEGCMKTGLGSGDKSGAEVVGKLVDLEKIRTTSMFIPFT